MEHLLLQSQSLNAYHIGSIHVKQAPDSRFVSNNFSIGASLSRTDIHVSLAGEGAEATLNGLYVAGGDKRLVIRGVGPTLGAFGVAGTLADPIVELRQGQTLVQANDNWLASDAATIAASGAFALPNGSLDAALVLTLKPEAYTAQTRGANNGNGIALVEIFDADANAGSSRLVNASTRAFVGTGAAVLIPGIAVSGSGWPVRFRNRLVSLPFSCFSSSQYT